ncbi:MAG: MMPL family transporter [Bacteroidia bacterium]|nr:MMPL family transporter [Bacteroidia bacterium]
MWSALGRAILRYRVQFLILLMLLTAGFAYMATRIELSYTYQRALPKDDPDFIRYEQFRSRFGGDDKVLLLGFSDPDIFKLDRFNAWYDTDRKIREIQGVKDVLSVTSLYNIRRNDSLVKFEFKPIITQRPSTQQELDSLKEIILNLPFYDGLAFKEETSATVMAVTFNEKELNSRNRISIVHDLVRLGDEFANKLNVEIHYSGVPYIRTYMMEKVSMEMGLFLGLAILVTTIILWVFFRSFNAVFFSVIQVIISAVWSFGTLALFGYKITLLTGLIPPLVVIIGLPNCIFLINKYQEELRKHGNKVKALSRTVEKVGLSNLLANVTTAIGFFVFYFTNSTMLMEFGIVAAVNVMTTYTIALFFIPIVFSYLPAPSGKATSHLEGKRINFLINWVDKLIHRHRRILYLITTVVTVVAIYGMFQVKVIGYVVDDLPKRDPIYTHLKFFESNFGGVLPFEVSIDSKKRNGIFTDNAKTLYKMRALQKKMAEYEELSRPVSIVEVLKFAYQSYNDGKPKYFILPGATELKKLSDYTKGVKGGEDRFASFIDSTHQYTRISYQVADIGSVRLKALLKEIQPRIDSIFPKEEYDVGITGYCSTFLKGNDYLFHHLMISLIIAIVLILIIGMILFRSVAIIILSKAPALIPLVITAGIMGFLGIPFKPSTILIFSIAFGIASDGTIYILTEYRNQLLKGKNTDKNKAISRTIHEIGISMIYTAVILFSGFVIFSVSSFGGTVSLGILLSVTLLVSLFTNLVLLPSILLSLEKRIVLKALKREPLINLMDEEEDIDHEKLEIQKRHHKKDENE